MTQIDSLKMRQAGLVHSAHRGWIWVLVALLVTGTRFYESGISLDPAVYASVARNFARNGNWWSMTLTPTLFKDFAEHPFLLIWLQGLVFKYLGANDITARLVGIFFGSASFYFIYQIGKLLVDETYAGILTFCTLLSVYFTGRIPTFYLEVGLTFFMLGALYFELKCLARFRIGDAILSGLFLGCAFLSKGMAALPMLGVLWWTALYFEKSRALRSKTVWLFTITAAGVVVAFLYLQSSFGTYSFLSNYLSISLFKKAPRPGFLNSVPLFWKSFFLTHPVHTFFAGLGIIICWPKPNLRPALSIGLASSALFLCANACIGALNYHYFYSLYPFVNLLAATGLYLLLSQRSTISWQRWGMRVAVAYAFIWSFLPIPMRRKPDKSFAQLLPAMQMLKKQGFETIESVGIHELDWSYREMAIWYWDIDTQVRPSVEEVKGQVVILPQTDGPTVALLQKKNFSWCATSGRYTVLVRTPELERACRESPATSHRDLYLSQFNSPTSKTIF